MRTALTMASFTSASTAGVVNVEFGFVPDAVFMIQDIDGTNPNFRAWVNNDEFAEWAAALSVLLTGSTGVVTRDTTGITAFTGGNQIATAETAASDPKHVTTRGTPAAAGHIAAAGIAIPADHQTNSGKNFLIALRVDD